MSARRIAPAIRQGRPEIGPGKIREDGGVRVIFCNLANPSKLTNPRRAGESFFPETSGMVQREMKRRVQTEGLLWRHWERLHKRRPKQVVLIDALRDASWTTEELTAQ